MNKPTTTLDADDLLHGAFYALEQGGRLLQDAVNLWEQQRYSSAVVLGVFAREEIGRFKILLQERDEALKSGPRNLSVVRDLCTKHMEKLRAAPSGTSLHFDAKAPGLEGLNASPQSEEFKKAHAILDERIKKKAENQPKHTHVARMAALYVDVDAGTKNWNRPADITPAASGCLLMDVANDYAPRFSNLQARPTEYYEELSKAFLAWPERPTLPAPVWPNLSGVVLPLEDA